VQPGGEPPEIEFEREYRDRVTGFVGKCTGFCRYISGCDQVLLQPSVDKDGKRSEGIWIDDERLIDVAAEKAVKRTSRRGADTPAPIR
jgi:hypothetical protein